LAPRPLNWTVQVNVPGTSPVSGYRIYRGTASGKEVFLVSVTETTTSYTDAAVADGTTYYYEVSAVSAAGDSPMSAEAVAQRGTPPSAPTRLTATAGKAQVGLAWGAPSSNGGSPVTGYDIYRGTASGGETFLASVGASTTSYTDAGVARRTRYYYRITALNSLGESAASAEVSAVPK
jgi:fibronectin type 3 domain-containing protein